MASLSRASALRLTVSMSLATLAALLGGCAPATSPTAKPQVAIAERADPDLGPFSVHLLANRTEMEMAGDMNNGVTTAVRKLLDANPSIHVIHLNSPGGATHEGYLLSLLIKDRHLATYTSTICASACTEAFLAGSPRYLAKGAKLGFHSPSLGGAPTDVGNDALRAFYQGSGISDAFIDRAMRTPPTDIWVPTDKELRDAHVVDEIVDKSKFAISGTGYWQSPEEVDEALKTNALYGTIAAHDPTAYAEIRRIFLKGSKAGRDTAEIQNEANALIDERFLPRYLARVPDLQVRHYLDVQMQKLDYLRQHAPADCAASAFPKLGLPAPTSNLPIDITDAEFTIITDVVANAFPGQPMSDMGSDNAKAWQRYLHNLATSSPDVSEIFQHPEAHKAEPDKLCHAMTTALDGLGNLPAGQSAALARYLFSGGES